MARDTQNFLSKAIAFQNDGRFAEAEQSYRDALAISPEHQGSRHNLAVLMARRGDARGALPFFDQLIKVNPGYVSAHFNRARALHSLGRREEGLQGFNNVINLDPDHYEAHRALGFLQLEAGNRARSLDHFARTYEINRAGGHSKQSMDSLRTGSKYKLEHDANMFWHLSAGARDGHRFEMLARRYNQVAGELCAECVELSQPQLDMLGEDYNTPIHLVDAPEITGGAVNPNVAWAQLDRQLSDDRRSVVWADELLTSAALASIQRLLMESTVWHDFTHIDGFVASYLEDGLACPLVLQIADEVRQLLPGLMAGRHLTQAWAFKALCGDRPIALHADDAHLSLNFWLTPRIANQCPDTGGLTIYRALPPDDWSVVEYNEDQLRIREFVEQYRHSRMDIPYRQNRAVLFNSRLFHGTHAPDFAPGYHNHRVNITMLFGNAVKL